MFPRAGHTTTRNQPTRKHVTFNKDVETLKAAERAHLCTAMLVTALYCDCS
jgi:hypothetical protein